MGMQEQIEIKLEKAFAPERLIVHNESHLHAGHAGDDGTGESHFKIEIAAKALDNMSRVARERAIFQALGAEMKIIHALTIQFI